MTLLFFLGIIRRDYIISSQVINKFVDGLRNSKQVLFKDNLYRKHSGVQWRCGRCISMISIYEDRHTVTKEPSPHIGHEDYLTIRIHVLKAIKKMKDEAYNDSSATLSSI